MTKADIAREISDHTGLTRTEALAAAEAFVASVTRAMHRGVSVEIRGFGTFKSVVRAPRTGRNPRTGEEAPIPSRRVVAFRPGQSLRTLGPKPED